MSKIEMKLTKEEIEDIYQSFKGCYQCGWEPERKEWWDTYNKIEKIRNNMYKKPENKKPDDEIKTR